MELPPYRLPSVRSLSIHMWQKAEHYLKKMGGVVLLCSLLLWLAGTFPRPPASADNAYAQTVRAIQSSPELSEADKAENLRLLQIDRQADNLTHTLIGKIGKFLEPVVKPLGFDWRGAVSLVSGFVAKEIVVSSMGVLYAVGQNIDEHSRALRAEIAHHFTPLSGFAFMVFVLLYTPCIVSLTVLVRELKSLRWGIFSVGYQLVLAWICACAVYQGGRAIGLQ
jgi:ferrous iron transport protein B